MPFYIGADSADVWANRELFLLNEDGTPNGVAAAPPDAFAKEGQKWGAPVYNWQRMELDEFLWWQKRVKKLAEMCDVIRLEHFNGIVKYYTVSNEAENGTNGKWSKGPGRKFTDAVEKAAKDTHIIVENLGIRQPLPGVKKLLAKTGWAGLAYLYEYLNIKYKEEIPDALIQAAYASVADLAIIQMMWYKKS